MTQLDEKIKRFYDLKKQIEDLTILKESLSDEIKNLIINEPDKKYENSDGYLVKCISRITYKYADETGIVDYLTKKGLSDIYMTKKIDSTKLNKELKNEGELYKALKNYIVKNVSESLEIKLN